MKVTELIKIIESSVDENIQLNPSSPLIGKNSRIDSMNLVQICISLEEKSQDDGFNFDWTSEKAMSSLNSIFKTPTTLTNEYNLQMQNKKIT